MSDSDHDHRDRVSDGGTRVAKSAEKCGVPADRDGEPCQRPEIPGLGVCTYHLERRDERGDVDD